MEPVINKRSDVVFSSFGPWLAIVALLLSNSISNAVSAQEESPQDDPLAEVLAGHSYHGSAFNEGARQAARILGGTGKVDFAVTTESDEASRFFNQGLGQLHGFWDLAS